MMRQATRIRDRAIRRCGELLKQIEPGQGARDGKREAGARPPLRGEAAASVGMSPHQAKQAIRVANVPAAARFSRSIGVTVKIKAARGEAGTALGNRPAVAQDRQMDDLRCTAVHESGHAVMAIRLGLRIQSMSIVPVIVNGIRRNGGTHIHGAIKSKQNATETALCFLAAYPACIAAGVDGWLGRQDDMDGAIQILSTWCDNVDAVYDECDKRATEEMQRPENVAAVRQLSDLLLESTMLGGEEIQACIVQSDAALSTQSHFRRSL